ncbi:MAG: hypothetical protein VB096_08160 [Pseudoflavonifractor sp.]|nr:hypothetical protein [Pseudoflavonifractor sp.]
MQKKQRRDIVLFLCAAALILFPTAAATVRSVIRPMAGWEIERCSAYDLILPGAAGAAPTPAEILAYCAPAGERVIGGNVCASYTSAALPQYLTNCRALTDICVVSGVVYLSYVTDHSKMVTLTYAADGVETQTVYDESSDTAYFLSPDGAEAYTNFRRGSPPGGGLFAFGS